MQEGWVCPKCGGVNPGTTGRSNLGVPVAPESGLPERVGLAEGGEG